MMKRLFDKYFRVDEGTIIGVIVPIVGIGVPMTVDANSVVENVFPVDKCFKVDEGTIFGVVVPISSFFDSRF